MIFTVFKKELIDTLRDKRTIRAMLLVPLLVFPAIFGLMTYFQGYMEESDAKSSYNVLVIGDMDKDLMRIISFQEPHYVKIAGTPDEFAVMNTPDAYDGLLSILPENTRWKNQCPARILLRVSTYRPIASARRIRCPALIQVALKDSLIDARTVIAAARKIPTAELMEYDIGHFDIYTGKVFEKAAAAQIRFLTRRLLP